MATRGNIWIALFYALLVVVHVVVTMQRARHWEFPNRTDELQHLSFVIHFRENRDLFPDYSRMRVLQVANDFSWSPDPNYLNHPIFYHAFLGAFVNRDDTLGSAALRLRRVNAGMSALGLTLILVFGFGAFREVRQHLLFGLCVVFCPMIGGLGGQINADNLAFLGGALVLVGLGRLFREGIGRRGTLVTGIGFALGALAKLTAAVMLGFWIVLALLALGRRGGLAAARPGGPMLILGVLALVGCAPYIVNLLSIGTPLYDNAALFKVSDDFQVLPFSEFAAWFLHGLAASWSTDQPSDAVQMATFVLVVGLMAFGFLARGKGPAVPVGRCCALAALAVLPIHMGYDYAQHRAAGHLAGADFRQYLPLWGGLAAGVGLAVAALRREGARAALVLLVAGLLFYSAVLAPLRSG
jgi:hypothetical protein